MNFTFAFFVLCVTMHLQVYCANYIWRFRHAFVITDECLSCGACAAQCPAEAISMGDLHYEIDADKCLECGACAAQCPAEAIEG